MIAARRIARSLGRVGLAVLARGKEQERENFAMMIELIEKYYRLFIRTSSSLESTLLLAVRLYWGGQFMQAGWGKLHDIGKVIGFHLGIRAPVLSAIFRLGS